MLRRTHRRLLILAQYAATLPVLSLAFPQLWQGAVLGFALPVSLALIYGCSSLLRRGEGQRLYSLQWQLGVGLDERERMARDHAIRVTLAAVLVIVFVSCVALGVLFNNVQWARQAIAPLFFLQWIGLTMIFTLPASIVMWNEADCSADVQPSN